MTRSRNGVALLLFGVVALFIKLNNPRVQELAISDIIALIAVGLCVGIGLVLILDKHVARRA